MFSNNQIVICSGHGYNHICKKMCGVFVFIMLADLTVLTVAQAPQWTSPLNTSLVLDIGDSNACDNVTILHAKSGNSQAVELSLFEAIPDGNFTIETDNSSGVSVLQCHLESITEEQYNVSIRAQYGDGNYTDITLYITVIANATEETGIYNCTDVRCENGGTCNYFYNDYNCTCAPGYEGTFCEMDTDDCQNISCANGGTCQDGINDYSCICKQGYDGTHCETDIDECQSSPCTNGGTCEDRVNSYHCKCPEGSEGIHCQIVHGGFSLWSEWSVCSVTCGDGIQTRGRECNNPPSAGGGRNCSGFYTETRACAIHNECEEITVCSGSQDTTGYVVVVVILSLVAVTLAVYVVYLRLSMKRNAGKLGFAETGTVVKSGYQNLNFENVAYVGDETNASKQDTTIQVNNDKRESQKTEIKIKQENNEEIKDEVIPGNIHTADNVGNADKEVTNTPT